MRYLELEASESLAFAGLWLIFRRVIGDPKFGVEVWDSGPPFLIHRGFPGSLVQDGLSSLAAGFCNKKDT